MVRGLLQKKGSGRYKSPSQRLQSCCGFWRGERSSSFWRLRLHWTTWINAMMGFWLKNPQTKRTAECCFCRWRETSPHNPFCPFEMENILAKLDQIVAAQLLSGTQRGRNRSSVFSGRQTLQDPGSAGKIPDLRCFSGFSSLSSSLTAIPDMTPSFWVQTFKLREKLSLWEKGSGGPLGGVPVMGEAGQRLCCGSDAMDRVRSRVCSGPSCWPSSVCLY